MSLYNCAGKHRKGEVSFPCLHNLFHSPSCFNRLEIVLVTERNLHVFYKKPLYKQSSTRQFKSLRNF